MHLHAEEGVMLLGTAAAIPDMNSSIQAQLHQLCAVVPVLTTLEDAQAHTSHRHHGTKQSSTAPCAGP